MRILTIASEVPPVTSGVARSTATIAEGLHAAGHDVELRSGADGHQLRSDRIRLSTVGLRTAVEGLAGYDVVHIHGPAPSISDVILARMAVAKRRPKLLYTHHFWLDLEVGLLGPLCALYNTATRRLARSADVIVTSTAAYAERFRCAGGPPVETVPWGVDTPVEVERRRPGSGALRVLLVGQFRRYKGHRVALAAIAAAPGVTVTIAGSGPLEPELRTAARDERVTLVVRPTDDELDLLYRNHDVILLPSTSIVEAFGITLVEGMARGCVPVASDLPGVAEVAGTVGHLFEPGDHHALARILAGLAADRTATAQRGNLAIDHAAALTWEQTVARYNTIVGDLVAAAP